jgi:predicted O-methyltransferase YrrM
MERTHPDEADLPERVVRFLRAHWAPGLGMVDGADALFLAQALRGVDAPARVVEIGCASGLSTGLLALLLDARAPDHGGPGGIDSFDLADRFYAAPERPLGYLLDSLDPPPRTAIRLHPGATALDAAQTLPAGQADLALIDANHRHPWPLVDTLCVLPLMRPGRLIVHHDLKMYRSVTNPAAIGPKVLFDQVPRPRRVMARPAGAGRSASLPGRRMAGNIFAIRSEGEAGALAARLAQGFYLPWTVGPAFGGAFAARFAAFLEARYPPEVARAFAAGRDRYAPPGAEAPPPSPPRRALRRLRRLTGL